MDAQRLGNLCPDAHHRIEARHRFLEDHRDAVAAQSFELRLIKSSEVPSLNQDTARRHASLRLWYETHNGEGCDRLSTAGLADQGQRLVAVECERDAVDSRIPLRTNAKFGPKIFDTQHRFAHGRD